MMREFRAAESRVGPERRVLPLIDTDGPGGGEMIFLQVAAGLRERGWLPGTIVFGEGWLAERARSLGLPVHLVGTSRRFDVNYLRKVYRIATDLGADLIHAHFFSPSLYASAIASLMRIPV